MLLNVTNSTVQCDQKDTNYQVYEREEQQSSAN